MDTPRICLLFEFIQLLNFRKQEYEKRSIGFDEMPHGSRYKMTGTLTGNSVSDRKRKGRVFIEMSKL